MNIRALTGSATGEQFRAQTSVVAVFAVGCIALGLLFNSEVLAAVAVWDSSTAYNHCFLVIPIVAYLLWDRRGGFSLADARPYPLAALAAIPLALAWLVAERLSIMEGRQLVAMSFLQLLFFIVLGPALWWRIAGPLLYLYFLVPFGAFLTPALQDFTAVFVHHGLDWLHIPAYFDGFLIEIPEGTFLIAEACAGLRFLIAATAFGCLYALLMYRSPLRRGIFIAASLVVPIIANGFRALGIVLLGHYLGSAEAVEADHVLYGWLFFSIVIVLLIIIGLPFREDHRPYERPLSTALPPPGHAGSALIGAAVLLVVAALGPAVAVQLDRTTVPQLPAELASFVPTPGSGCTSDATPVTEEFGAPGRMIVQRVRCAGGVVRLVIEVFSPRSTSSQILGEQRRLTVSPEAEDVEIRPLQLADAPARMWRMVTTPKPAQVAAFSLWLEGRPAQGGFGMRVRQALNSIMGSRFSPVLAVVIPEENTSDGGNHTGHGEQSITAFLRSQRDLTNQITRLAGSDNRAP